MKNVPAEGDKHPHLPSDESCSDEEMSPEQRGNNNGTTKLYLNQVH